MNKNMDEFERTGLIDAERRRREEPTQFVAPDRGQKVLACYAVASIRLKGVSKEQAASVMAVLIWLIKHANPTNGRCDPGIRKLAFETGLGEKTVRRAIKAAEEIGYLEVEARRGHTSAYHLKFDAMVADFHDIEEQAKNLPRSHMTGHPGHSSDLPTSVSADLLIRKGESVEVNTYPERAQPPSASGAAVEDLDNSGENPLALLCSEEACSEEPTSSASFGTDVKATAVSKTSSIPFRKPTLSG